MACFIHSVRLFWAVGVGFDCLVLEYALFRLWPFAIKSDSDGVMNGPVCLCRCKRILQTPRKERTMFASANPKKEGQ